jgi:hypothetical protein
MRKGPNPRHRMIDGESYYLDFDLHGNAWAHCPHDARGTTFTREPCVCGREQWPLRGRGRGESKYSPRRAQAQMLIPDMMALRFRGLTWDQIAARYGYKDRSGPFRLVYRWMAEHNDRGRLLRPAEMWSGLRG